MSGTSLPLAHCPACFQSYLITAETVFLFTFDFSAYDFVEAYCVNRCQVRATMFLQSLPQDVVGEVMAVCQRIRSEAPASHIVQMYTAQYGATPLHRRELNTEDNQVLEAWERVIDRSTFEQFL